MTELSKLEPALLSAAADLPRIITQTMRDALRLVGQTAATRYMIQTGTRSGRVPGGLPSNTIGTNPTLLTWRTGRLARSLVRTDDAENITRIRQEGTMIIGEVGTKVPYAPIHEYGGTIPARVQPITPRMRRFFWAKFYETRDEKWKRVALKARPPVINVPAIRIRPRPFLGPTVRDEKLIREDLASLFGARVPEQMAENLRLSLEGGRS